MEVMQLLHMNKGEKEVSYAKNCNVQKQIISFGNTILEQAVADSVENTLPNSMGIADLGCSSGPNTLMVVSEIINCVYNTSFEISHPLPELRVTLNDLPGNDFNGVLVSLPEFYDKLKKEKGIQSDRCFISAMAGSFYGRLFPSNSLHFVHSSSSLHWLSQVPLHVVNKGKIYISKTSNESVVKAYLSQFEKDLMVFLRSRAAEVVAGGKMVLSFMGRASSDAAAEVGSHQWELLAQALMALAREGIIEEEKIDAFDAPYYAPSPQEVRKVIEEEGSFVVNHLEAFEIGWDGSCCADQNGLVNDSLIKSQHVAKMIRAVVEPMLESQFGTQIMDELFCRYEDEVSNQKGTRGKQKRRTISTSNIPDHLLPKVAIVGRPNVGKSALFNRLVGGNRAIVVDEPGVTRDRLYGRSYWGDYEFMIVDTGGVLTLSKYQEDVKEELAIQTTIGMEGIPLASREAAVARMPSMVEKQASIAVEESSVIIFVVDGQAGLTAADIEIGDWLRKNYSHKSIVLAVNKCESPRKGILQASEFWNFGLPPLPISALSGSGTGELLDSVCSQLKKSEAIEETDAEEYLPSIAIVGRPNVGKSSILNALVGEDRTIVSPISGTTRDAIDTEFTGLDGQKWHLIDTAGIRKKAAVASSGSTTEALSVNRAFRAVRRSDVVALVIEAMACITEQDFKIAEQIEREGKGCLIVVNKWDTIPNKNQQTATYYEEDLRGKLRILSWAPIVYSTAIQGNGVEKITVAAGTVQKERSRRLSTATLNQVVSEAVAFKPPPRTRGGKRGRVYYCTQAAIRPPTFVFFVNDSTLFPETYHRYMEKQLRSSAGFIGTPIRLIWRSRRKSDKIGKEASVRTQVN